MKPEESSITSCIVLQTEGIAARYVAGFCEEFPLLKCAALLVVFENERSYKAGKKALSAAETCWKLSEAAAGMQVVPGMVYILKTAGRLRIERGRFTDFQPIGSGENGSRKKETHSFLHDVNQQQEISITLKKPEKAGKKVWFEVRLPGESAPVKSDSVTSLYSKLESVLEKCDAQQIPKEGEKTNFSDKDGPHLFLRLFKQLRDVPVFGCNKSGQIKFWNQACEGLYGYSEQEVKGKQLDELLVPELKRDSLRSSIKTIFDKRVRYTARERERLRKDGKTLVVLTHKMLVENESGPELVIVDIDITERVEAGQRLRQTKKALEERVKEQACLYRVAKLNEQKHSATSMIRQVCEFVQKGMYTPESAEVCIMLNGKAQHTSGFCADQPYLSASVKNDRVRIEIRVMYREDSNQNGFLEEEQQLIDTVAELLLLKISTRENSIELNRSRNALQKILDESLDIICTFHEDGRFLFVSKACHKILGYTPEEMSGRQFLDFVYEEDLDRTREKSTQIRQGLFATDFDNRYKAKDGRPVDLRWSSYWNADTGLFYGVARDVSERKKAEHKLEENERRFRALIQEGVEMVALTDAGGSFTYASPSYDKILGADPARLIGSYLFELVTDEDRPWVEEQFAKLKTRKTIKTEPYRVKTPSGNIVWLQSNCTNMLDDPVVNGIVVNSVEITDLIKTQRELEDSEARLRKASEIAKTGYWRFESESETLYWSDEVYRIWEVDKREFRPTYENVLRTVHPEDLQLFYDNRAKADAGLHEFAFDHRIILPDGREKWVREMTQRIPVSNEQYILEGTVQDISRQREGEQRLSLLESVAVNSRDGILILDRDARNFGTMNVRYANKAFTTMFGRDADEVEGLNLHSIFSSVLAPDDISELDKAVAEVTEKEISCRLSMNGQKSCWATVSLLPVSGEEEEISHWVLLLRDETRKKQEEQDEKMRAKITSVFSKQERLEEALKETSAYLAKSTESDFGEIWIVSADKKRINYATGFHPDKLLSKLDLEARRMGSFGYGTGLPGAVWKMQQQQLWYHPSGHENFIRKEAVAEAGVEAVYGIPLIHDQEVIGVLVLGTAGMEREPMLTLSLTQHIGTFLGAEIKRKQLEEELNNIYSLAPDVICTAGFDGYLKRINPAATNLLGYSAEEMLATPVAQFIHPDDHSKTRNLIDPDYSSEQLAYEEIRFITKSGSVRWLALTTNPVPEEGLIYCIAKNVTDKKNLEDLLENATQLARIGSWEVDLQDNDVYWSEITRQIHEEDPEFEPTLDEGLSYYKEGSSRDIISQAVQDAVEKGKKWDLELPIITAKGNERWIRTIGEAEFHNGTCVRLIGSFQDIHSRKMTELALTKRNRFLDTITRVMGIFLEAETLGNAMNDTFKLVGETVGADRVYFFETEDELSGPEKMVVSLKYEWCRKGIKPDLDNDELQEHIISDFSCIYQPLSQGLPARATVSTIQDEAFKEIMQGSDIKSLLLLPVIRERKLEGYLGFDDCMHEREWSEADVFLLQSMASYMAVELQRRDYLNRLEESIQEKNTILESIGDGFFAIDESGRVIYWNKLAEELLLVNRDDILGTNLWDTFTEAVGMSFYEKYNYALKSGNPVHFEEYYPPLYKWFEVSAYPTGNKLGVYFRDITERKRSETLLRESNDRFEKTTMATNDAIYDWQIESDEIYWGDGFTTLFGFLPGTDLKGRESWYENLHPDDKDRIHKAVQRALDDPKADLFVKEYRFRKEDGSYSDVYDRGLISRDNQGRAVRMTGAISDVSVRKKHEASLRELNIVLEKRARELAVSNQELEQFAYVASHDLQEPLRMISSFLKQLEKKYSDKLDDRAHTYIHYAVDGAQRMRSIILDLLEYSRVGKQNENFGPVDTGEVVGDVCALYRQKVEESKAEIRTGELPVVQSYITPLRQIFTNLIGNALKYAHSERHPVIEITCEQLESEYVFCVKDNGIGIGREYHEKIFVIFQRLHHKDEYSGTGMGLAIVKKILDTLGGRIWIESEEGEGSSFYFTISK